MNSTKHLRNQLANYLITRPHITGFTLIELLVVILILGILASIAIPSLMRQTEKAREAEAKNNLGAINRAQEVHMFENSFFATDMVELNLQLTVGQLNGGNYETEFYTYSVSGIPNSNVVRHLATAKPFYTTDIKDVSSAVFRSSGTFSSLICLGNDASVTPYIVDEDTCNNGKLVY